MTRIALASFVAGLLITAAGGLMGCGKKGPLYLPDTVQQEQSDEEQSKKKSNKQQ